jgi:5-methylcytosine-specific restriction endonuclease McrA
MGNRLRSDSPTGVKRRNGCEVCGKPAPWIHRPHSCFHVHHIQPVAGGGGNEPANLVKLCQPCHRTAHRIGLPGKDIPLHRRRAVFLSAMYRFMQCDMFQQRAA